MNKIDKLAELFPECITEAEDADGNLKRAVDFEKLRLILSDELTDGREAYEFNFVGKKRAHLEAYKRIRKTLRPNLNASRDFDTTQNLYIEGDNLDALKILAESYFGKVKMIYIDPPYNTGNDFIYRDDFAQDEDDFDDDAEAFDDEGNRILNRESRGRFHSDWCAMIYSRLLIAKHFLSKDGVIFISIDDHEQANLKKMCDEVFGEKNFVAQLVWEKKKKGAFLSKIVTNVKEYVFAYCKSIDSFGGLVGEINRSTETYPCVNAVNKRERRLIPRGIESKYKDKNYFQPAGTKVSNNTMDIVYLTDLVIENGIVVKDFEVEGNWRYSQSLMRKYALNGELYLTQELYLRRIVSEPRQKMLKDILSRVGDNQNNSFAAQIDLENLSASGWGSNEDADEELRLIFGKQKFFDYPKPTRLIKKILAAVRDSDSIVMDFFSGSATTAHAVMELNAQDGGNRKFIMIQIDEATPENSEARRAGYHSICEIGRERIRRAGDKLKSANPNLDVGFRVLKIDSSNFKPVPTDFDELLLFVENIEPDRNAYDLLFETLLDLSMTLDKPFGEEEIDGYKILSYDDGKILACFDKNVKEETFRTLAARKAKKIIFRDSCFASSSIKINALAFFKEFAPDTKVRVL